MTNTTGFTWEDKKAFKWVGLESVPHGAQLGDPIPLEGNNVPCRGYVFPGVLSVNDKDAEDQIDPKISLADRAFFIICVAPKNAAKHYPISPIVLKHGNVPVQVGISIAKPNQQGKRKAEDEPGISRRDPTFAAMTASAAGGSVGQGIPFSSSVHLSPEVLAQIAMLVATQTRAAPSSNEGDGAGSQ